MMCNFIHEEWSFDFYEEDFDDAVLKWHEIGERQKDRNVAAGFPLQCNSDEDCTLENGELGKCSCGFDGNFWCEPDMHSDVFDKFWDFVGDTGLIDYDVYTAWMGVMKYYIYLNTSPDCVMHNLEELKWLKVYTERFTKDLKFKAQTDESYTSALVPLILLILLN